MDPPEKPVPEQRPALIAVTDLLGLRSPATELVRAISKGIGNVFEPALRRRKAKADLAIYNEWKASLVDSDGLPSSFEFSIDDRASIRLQNETIQRQVNREKIAIEAIEEYRSADSMNRRKADEGVIDDDWLNFYWQAAEQVSNRDMQNLWGRVLARKALGISQYRLRTLDFLRTLSRSEAEEISRLASYSIQASCRWGTGVGVMEILGKLGQLDEKEKISSVNEKIKNCVVGLNHVHLGSIGFLIESGWSYEFTLNPPDDHILIQIADKILRVSGEFFKHDDNQRGYLYLGAGMQISPVGVEILTLSETHADPIYLELIKEGLEIQGLIVERL